MVGKKQGRVVIRWGISSRWRGVYSHVETEAHTIRDIGKIIIGGDIVEHSFPFIRNKGSNYGE